MRSLTQIVVRPLRVSLPILNLLCFSVGIDISVYNLNRIVVLQKKTIRIISQVSFDAHTGLLFKEQEILQFSEIYFYQIGKFMCLF